MFDSFKNILTTGGGLAAGFAIIMASWSYIKLAWNYLVGIFIGESVLKDEAGQAAMAFSFAKSIRSPIGKKIFGGVESYVHPRRWREIVAYECLGKEPCIIKYEGKYALLSLMGGHNSANDGIGKFNNHHDTLVIRYLRWSFNIEKFVSDSIEYLNNEKRQKKDPRSSIKNRMGRFKILRCSGNGGGKSISRESDNSAIAVPTNPGESDESGINNMIRLGIYRLLKWNREDLQLKVEEGQSPFTGYPFPDEVGHAIEELNGWLENEKWFRSKSIPWRRGWLLHGPPGTGKSTLVRALGMSFDLPVYIFDLAGMTNNDLVASWDSMMANTPCIPLIEDIDAIFHGREYVGSSSPNVPHLTFDCLLNCISGVKQADGVFTIITTNHIDKLDAALGIPDENGKSSRPGRIDRAIRLGNMKEPQRRSLANHILSDFPDLIEETISAGEGETAAQFQSRCGQLALDRFWKDGKFKNPSTQYVEAVHVIPTKEQHTRIQSELNTIPIRMD